MDLRSLADRLTVVEAKLRCMENAAARSSPPAGLSTGERQVYEAQIRCLKEDFAQERSDRERLASRAEVLERMLSHAKLEYSKLERQFMATRNVHRAEYNRIYGRDPGWYQSDCAEDTEEAEKESQTVPGATGSSEKSLP